MDLNQITTLVQAGKNKEAYSALIELLQKDPTNSEANKLKKQLEDVIQQNNSEIIKQSLNKIKTEINSGNYQIAISQLLDLKQHTSDNIEVSQLLEIAYNKLKNSQTQTQKNESGQLLANLKNLEQSQHYQEALNLITQAYQHQPSAELQKLLIETKYKYVSHKLKKNHTELYSIPPIKALNYLKSLTNISPSHKELQKLILEFTKKIQRQESINQDQYFKDQNRQIKVLYFEEKFKKCIELCNQLLLSKPNNFTAKKFRKKSRTALEIINHKNAVKNLQIYNQQLNKLSPEQKQAQYI